MSFKNHHYHLVNMSSWPLMGALSSLIFLLSIIQLFHKNNNNLMLLGTILIIMIMIQWWRDIIRESTFQGHHTKKVIISMKWGMMLFIISEIFFFISFFWSFFHISLSPTMEIGMNWPPIWILKFDAFSIPLLNTIILLSSGVSVTWAHHSLLNSNYKQVFQSLLITIILGIYFTSLQLYEYSMVTFSIADSCYGSSFFIATGFHGLHVLIGTMFLMICLIRHKNLNFSKFHHFGFEAAAWYWHFVDFVWLFLYISIYWWGN